jgi:hypothetical protein
MTGTRRQLTTKRWRAATLVVLGVSALLASGPTAQAAPAKPDPDTSGLMAQVPAGQRARLQAQLKAHDAADQINAVAAQQAGFAGLELHDGAVRLYYKGTPPNDVLAAVDKARATAPVEVRKATYALPELRAAADQMTEHMRTHPGGPAHRVSIPVDGSGLEVGVDAVTAKSAAATLPDVGVPVETVRQEPVAPRGRFDDTNPFYGGGAIRSWEGLMCSAGFSVTKNNLTYLLTSGHCGYPGQEWSNGADPDLERDKVRSVGTVVEENVSQDLMLIKTWAYPYMFTGASVPGTVGRVIRAETVYTGEELCSSAAFTGWLCGHVVRDAGNFSYCANDPWGNPECYSGLVWSRQEDGAQSSRPGDSGGPVVLPTAQGIVAKGTISAGGGADLVWQDFATAAQVMGVYILT